LTLALALTTVAANADEKVIYQDNFTDQAASLANWTNNRDAATTATSIASTSDGNYIQFGNGTASFNGTRFSSTWAPHHGQMSRCLRLATPWTSLSALPSWQQLFVCIAAQQRDCCA
jgi:hypothetical protein